MNKVTTFIVDVKSLSDWTEKVMKANTPVVLQFHADWCNPCRRLMPILEKETMGGEGKWVLAKVDIDEFKQLAQALKVTVVPTVFLVHRGQVVHRFEGAPEQSELKKFFDDVKLLAGLASEEDSIKGLHSAGEDFLSRSEWDNAIHSFEEILKYPKWNGKYELTCLLHLAKAYSGKKDISATEKLIGRLKTTYTEELRVNKEAGNVVAEVEASLKANSQNDTHRVYLQQAAQLQALPPSAPTFCQLSELHLKNGNSAAAIECALQAIELEGHFKGEGQATLLLVFKTLGHTHEMVRESRKRVQRLLSKFTV
jgi:thioredoxin